MYYYYYNSTDKGSRLRHFWNVMMWKLSPSRPVGILWALLSVLVSTTCLFAFLQPIWITTDSPVRPNFRSFSMGLFSYCYHQTQFHTDTQICRIYGGNFDFRHIPSVAWQAATLLFGSGSLLLLITAAVALGSVCCDNSLNRRIALFTGHFQALSVVLMSVGLAVVPIGFGSPFVRLQCGVESDIFRLGGCQMGWSYTLALMAALLAMFCPFLSKHTTFTVGDEPLQEEDIFRA